MTGWYRRLLQLSMINLKIKGFIDDVKPTTSLPTSREYSSLKRRRNIWSGIQMIY
jgi:hypothetical protein